eukprot:8198895-Alexandrium_andersonii.AAC.1
MAGAPRRRNGGRGEARALSAAVRCARSPFGVRCSLRAAAGESGHGSALPGVAAPFAGVPWAVRVWPLGGVLRCSPSFAL